MGTGAEWGALLGTAITSISGLLAVIISKCKCTYRHVDNECQPACGFSDKPLTPDQHEIEIFNETINDIPILIISKTSQEKYI